MASQKVLCWRTRPRRRSGSIRAGIERLPRQQCDRLDPRAQIGGEPLDLDELSPCKR
jgi:hypothetical protein